MVTQLLVDVLLGLVSFLLDLLPDDTVTWPQASSFGMWAGSLVGPLNTWLPLAEFVAVTTITITVVLPALLIYRLAMWLWTLLPDSISGSG